MEDRWEYKTKVVCIKEYKTLKLKRHYDIKGRGNLQFNVDPNVGGRTGHGFCIEDTNIPMMNRTMWGSPKPIWYYFTLKEMDEYFITELDNEQIELRDRKINQILDK
jgi:hypothetical protein